MNPDSFSRYNPDLIDRTYFFTSFSEQKGYKKWYLIDFQILFVGVIRIGVKTIPDNLLQKYKNRSGFTYNQLCHSIS